MLGSSTKGSRRNKFAFCCRPPGPLARRERRCVPGAVREERATKPAGLRAAARRGAILRVLDEQKPVHDWPPTLSPECEVISARALRTTTDRQSEGISIVNRKSSIVNRLLTCGKMPFFDALDKWVHP